MSFQKEVARREKVKLMLGLAGPSGSGKTLSALKLAYGITNDWSKIVVADTENKSALYYAGKATGDWQHVNFEPPYSPQRFKELIKFAESDPNTDVLILDSISHEWEGKGGCLDMVTEISRGSKGNTFTPWNTVTPLHNGFIDAMRLSRLHIISTMRAKQDYVIEQNEKGRAVPKKVGLKSVQREGVDYEFGVVFDIDISHFASVSKDRTGIFGERGPFKIDEAIGKELLAWANSGVAPKEEEDWVYAATPEQKIHLMNLFKSKGITDVTSLKIASDFALQKNLKRSELATNIMFERGMNEQ